MVPSIHLAATLVHPNYYFSMVPILRVSPLDERIYDPVLGSGVSSTQAVGKYLEDPKYDNDRLFISFTEIDKIGINPRSKYNTPLGIYTYPLRRFFKHYVSDERSEIYLGKFAPFAGESDFVWVLYYDGEDGYFIPDLGMMTEFELNAYMQTLEEIWDQETDREVPFSGMVARAKYEALIQTPGGEFWNITRTIAQHIVDARRKGNPSVAWNRILRQLDLELIADQGHGIIHSAEPLQAVFLQRKAFSVVERVENISSVKALTFFDALSDAYRNQSQSLVNWSVKWTGLFERNMRPLKHHVANILESDMWVRMIPIETLFTDSGIAKLYRTLKRHADIDYGEMPKATDSITLDDVFEHIPEERLLAVISAPEYLSWNGVLYYIQFRAERAGSMSKLFEFSEELEGAIDAY